jgi:uncharacterized RDD family membrane protein YckC
MTVPVSVPAASSPPIAKASFDRRFIAYTIDSLVGGGMASVFGARSAPSPAMWAAVAFLLLRDVAGASPGKLILGMRVVRRDDNTRPASILQCLGRNLVMAVAVAQGAVIPVAGLSAIWLLPLVAGVLAVFDGGYLWDTGERLSDRVVGTAVVRRIKATVKLASPR